jgi:hypothetical protein
MKYRKVSFQRKGVFITWGRLYFGFHQKWSKLGTLLKTDDNEAEMKKKFKIFVSATSYRTLF